MENIAKEKCLELINSLLASCEDCLIGNWPTWSKITEETNLMKCNLLELKRILEDSSVG